MSRALVDFAYEHRHSLAVFDALESFIDPRKVKDIFLNLRLLSRPLLACHSLLKIAKAVPSMQRSLIQSIPPPAALRLIRGYRVSLRQAWRSLGLPDADATVTNWMNNHDAAFQEDCGMPLKLVHAEVQLVNFYRRQPGATLATLYPYIGCSKKACFMCQLFLAFCNMKLRNRGCHGTISNVPWTVPCTMAPHLDKELAKMTAIIVERIKTVIRSPQIYVPPQKQSEIGSSVHDELIHRPYHDLDLARYKEILEDGWRKIQSL